jgi:hypothetical protein
MVIIIYLTSITLEQAQLDKSVKKRQTMCQKLLRGEQNDVQGNVQYSPFLLHNSLLYNYKQINIMQ